MATQAVWAVQTINLNDALQKKMIRIDMRGLGEVTGVNISSHYGKCIGMKVTNLTNNGLIVSLETGRYLTADSNEVQNMLVTQNLMAELQPNQTRRLGIYAMCCEHHDHAPDPKSTFKPGPMSKGNVLKLAQFIEEKKFQSSIAQNAVWALVDNTDISNVQGDDLLQQKLLREFLSQATGKPLPKEESHTSRNSMASRESREVYSISCWFDYEVQKASTVSITIYNTSGEVVKELMPPTETKSGSYSKTCMLSTAEFPIGEYEIKLQIGRTSTLSRKIYLGPHQE